MRQNTSPYAPPQMLRDPQRRARYDRVLTQRELRATVTLQDEIDLDDMEAELDPEGGWQQVHGRMQERAAGSMGAQGLDHVTGVRLGHGSCPGKVKPWKLPRLVAKG